MALCVRRIALSLGFVLAFTSAHSQQYLKTHNADLAVGGTGQFTTAITSQSQLNHQWATESAGFLLSFREHALPFAGLELNYQYSSLSERFASSTGLPLANIPVAFHEGTAAYLFHPHFRHLQPFVGLGGGVIFFNPSRSTLLSQYRATGLAEFGFDIPTRNPHLGFRMQGRSLLYRAPNFRNASLSSSRWVSTEEPSASVYFRF